MLIKGNPHKINSPEHRKKENKINKKKERKKDMNELRLDPNLPMQKIARDDDGNHQSQTIL